MRETDPTAGIKRKLRKLKKLEARIRFGSDTPETETGVEWVWDRFFSAKENARYPLAVLAGMNRDAYKEVIDAFIYQVYYRWYRDNPAAQAGGPVKSPPLDPEILTQLGLPPDADAEAARRKFHTLAKLYHPDAGGDEALFIALKSRYDQLTGRRLNHAQ